MKKSAFTKLFKEKDQTLSELEPVKKHTCSQSEGDFYFIHKTVAHEELTNRICEKALRKSGSKRKAATTNEYLVTLYMILLCDKDGVRQFDTSKDEFLEIRKDLMESPSFAYHLNGALVAIGEAPSDESEDGEMEGASKTVEDGKKPSSKTTKDV